MKKSMLAILIAAATALAFAGYQETVTENASRSRSVTVKMGVYSQSSDTWTVLVPEGKKATVTVTRQSLNAYHTATHSGNVSSSSGKSQQLTTSDPQAVFELTSKDTFYVSVSATGGEEIIFSPDFSHFRTELYTDWYATMNYSIQVAYEDVVTPPPQDPVDPGDDLGSGPFAADEESEAFAKRMHDYSPTTLRELAVTIYGKPAAKGDVVAAYDASTGAFCGDAVVLDDKGLATGVIYVPSGAKVHFKVWRAASGLVKPEIIDADPSSDLTVAESGKTIADRTIVVTDVIEQKFDLSGARWHMISFNVLPADPSPAAVFKSVAGKIDSVVRGSSTQLWIPGVGGTLKTIEVGAAYWVLTTASSVSWTVSGKAQPDAAIKLNKGWTMIGYAPRAEGDVTTVLKTALATNKITDIVDGTKVYPGTLKKMTPGKAYWVNATEAMTITYDK